MGKRRGEDRGDDTTALVLAVLRSDGPLHGYGIVRAIEKRSAAALRPGEGVLYPALLGLEADGLIAGVWETPVPGKPARKVYTLTESGLAELERRRQAWRAHAAAVDAVFGGGLNAEPA